MVIDDEVKRAFARALDVVAGVYVWGSHTAGTAHAGSDVDVCVVAGPGVRIDDALRASWRGSGISPRYDVHVFEELPLYLQGAVLDGGRLVAARDELALSEYLRPFRKIWDDQRRRATPTEDDIARILAARRRASG